MQQVLFWIPFKTRWFPEGLPVYAYGAMLFVAFVVCVWFTARRAAQLGIPLKRDKVQDMAIFLFVVGLIGARLVYKLQFDVPWHKFLNIWEGGIVLYGGIIGGALGFLAFYYWVLKPLQISIWQMGDLLGPSLALGIAIGRVGCLLNGCCWGNVANPGCPAVTFPLLTAPAREMLVDRDGLQTVLGFQIRRGDDGVRTVVGPIEPGSAAAAAGLKERDQVVKFKIADDWIVNGEVLILSGSPEAMSRARETLKDFGTIVDVDTGRDNDDVLKLTVNDPAKFEPAYFAAQAAAGGRPVIRMDVLGNMLNNWPRGRNSVQFVVERDGAEIELPEFTPRTIGLHPTQIYETISMMLIVLFLLAFYPFRRHDGQVWVVFMVLYAVHRFLNEILRTEPVEGLKMTLSQNISVGVVLVAVALEIYLRQTQPRRV